MARITINTDNTLIIAPNPEEPKFEVVSTFAGQGINLPQRATEGSAGYDFEAAEDTIIPPIDYLKEEMVNYAGITTMNDPRTLDEIAAITKAADAKVTLIPTGIKCKLPEGTYLELAVRSSLPLKHWLILGNSVGKLKDYLTNL